ncbi:MAG: hypothetical protein ABIP94_10345 [Planctomycetota bacterium]
MTPTNDRVREFLAERGCAKHVVKWGLAGLVASWEELASILVEPYVGDLDDYLNDLDTRQILAETLPIADADVLGKFTARIAEADDTVREATKPFGKCVWGSENAASHDWTVRRNWWYFRVPKLGNDALANDLERVR